MNIYFDGPNQDENNQKILGRKGFLFGNGMKTIQYTSNGDASDWMLFEKGLLSFSPELGNGKSNSDTFYPNKDVTFDVLQLNINSAFYTIQKSSFFITLNTTKNTIYNCSSYKLSKLQLSPKNLQKNQF